MGCLAFPYRSALKVRARTAARRELRAAGAKVVPINKRYQPLYRSNKRYFFVTGGRGSLKSSTVHDFIARLTYQQGHGVLFTRYTMTSAETSIIPEFLQTLDRLGITADFQITKRTITNRRTGSFIYFSGIKTSSGDQTANLKSIAGITTWVIEEGEDFTDERAFDAIDDSIRTTTAQNRVIWIQNPTTKEHFIYKRWIEPANKRVRIEGFDVTLSAHADVEHIHTTYHLADKQGYLDQSWIKKAEGHRAKMLAAEAHLLAEGKTHAAYNARHNSFYYHNYIGGWQERAEGVIFDNWIEGEFDHTLPSVVGLDYGYAPDPLAGCRVAVDEKQKRIYLHELIYDTEIDDVADELDYAGVSKRDLVVADTSENRTTATVRKAGFNIVKAVKEMIVDDVRAIKGYTLVVSPTSANIKSELNNYVWNDKKASVPIDDYNHLMDAMRYAYNRLKRGRRKTKRRNR